MENKRLRNEKGITLIALILTIIILLILATISFDALVGDNGILGNAISAKVKQQEETAKEELQLAWSARMSKFYEAVAKGEQISITDFFSKADALEDLNSMMGSDSQIDKIDYILSDNVFYVRFKGSDNSSYTIKIKPSGEILEADENKKYTDVWANFFESEGKMTYTTAKDESATISWDISKPIYKSMDVPWYYYDNNIHWLSGYVTKIAKVEISEDLYPESTQFMFYYLRANQFEGLDLLLSKITEIGEDMFFGCYNLASITIPNNITSIGRSAFYSCESLTSIDIPNSVTSIGRDAFYSCKSLTSIDIPNSVTDIDDMAFCFCSGVTSISIPDSVLHIGYNAFSLSSYLSSGLNLNNQQNCIEPYAFYDCNALTSINISEGVTMIGDKAFLDCYTLTSIVLPNSLTSIGDYAFYSCDSLTDITIPENVEMIGKGAFANMDSLKTLNYNAKDVSKNEIKKYPIFYKCINLTEINIGTSVIMLPNYFAYDLNITTIKLPNSLTSIGDYAFYSCDSLTDITIPAEVKNLGKYCFAHCGNLDTVYYNATDAYETDLYNPSDDTVAPPFSGSGNHLYIGDNVITLPDYIFRSMTKLTSITLPSGLESIGKEVFCNLKITSIEIPSNVTNIGEDAFYNCTFLETITIRKAEGSIDGAPWSAPNLTAADVIWEP